jgi:N-methylhydantoinase B
MKPDPVELEIFKSLFHSVAEEMGAALRRTAFSPNIKERRDYSCAVFSGDGEVLAMGDHMPVHLGSMPLSVSAAIAELDLGPGDIAILNDPYRGGTHLPDITLVMPVFAGQRTPLFYVASRAHHADVGGMQPGSMSLAREIYQEGIRIGPLHLVRRGRLVQEVVELILSNVRTPREREGDLAAQLAACRTGERRLGEMVTRYGVAQTRRYQQFLLAYSEAMMRDALRRLPAGRFRAEDVLDDDGLGSGPLRLKVTLELRDGRATVDFTGTAPQCAGNVNAVFAITYSAVFYVFRCLLGEEVPATAGLMRPIRVLAPAGSLVNAEPPAAVAGGNVETSQRIVDVLLRALAQALPDHVPAASQGTMNNLTLGGRNPLRNNEPFVYYETIAGGMGARPGLDGLNGIHTHMTNSLNTPVEVLEHELPVRVRRYGLRRGSGGAGRWRGGDGIVREIELLAEMQMGLLAERRRFRPYGLAGGQPGAPGRNWVTIAGRREPLPAKCSRLLPPGAVLTIETPGGGGWGKPVRKGPGRRQD